MSTPSSSGCSKISATLEAADLFQTWIWQSRLTNLAPLLPGWIEAAAAFRAASPVSAGGPTRRGWTGTGKAILDQRVFAELHGALRACCQHALKQMGAASRPFTLESWITIHDRDGFDFVHMHENRLLSGIFYLQAPEGTGRLAFRDPRPGVLNAPFKGAGANAHNEIQLTPEAGIALLFPNWLDHYAEPHGNDLPAISISFNAIGT